MTDKLTLAEEIEALVLDGCDCEDCRVIRAIAARLRVLAGEMYDDAAHDFTKYEGEEVREWAQRLAPDELAPREKRW